MEKKAMVGAVMAIIAVILIGVTLALPWYNITATGSFMGQSATMKADFYLDHGVISTPFGSMSQQYNGTTNTEKTFKNTEILDIVGLVFAIIGFIGAILLAVGKMGKGAAVSLVAIGFILSLIAPIYLYAVLPGAFQADAKNLQHGNVTASSIFPYPNSFFGHKSYNMPTDLNQTTKVDVSWGGGIGWWLAIVGMIFMLLALIFVAIARKPQPVAPPPMAPAPPEAMPPAPPMEGQTGETQTEELPPQ